MGEFVSTEIEQYQRTAPERPTVVVSGVASDSHTWNLVFLQLLIEECGYDVVNLGPCVPDEELVRACQAVDPALVVISSVNGHGYQDGLRVIDKLRASEQLVATPMVIGGKLGMRDGRNPVNADQLVTAGFDAVFDDSGQGIVEFRGFVTAITAARGQPATGGQLGTGGQQRDSVESHA